MIADTLYYRITTKFKRHHAVRDFAIFIISIFIVHSSPKNLFLASLTYGGPEGSTQTKTSQRKQKSHNANKKVTTQTKKSQRKQKKSQRKQKKSQRKQKSHNANKKNSSQQTKKSQRKQKSHNANKKIAHNGSKFATKLTEV